MPTIEALHIPQEVVDQRIDLLESDLAMQGLMGAVYAMNQLETLSADVPTYIDAKDKAAYEAKQQEGVLQYVVALNQVESLSADPQKEERSALDGRFNHGIMQHWIDENENKKSKNRN